MNSPALLALQQVHGICQVHRNALRDALGDLHLRDRTASGLGKMTKDDRRLLDQFAYRYTRIQDDIGVRLMPAVLRVLGDEPAAMPVLDRLDRRKPRRIPTALHMSNTTTMLTNSTWVEVKTASGRTERVATTERIRAIRVQWSRPVWRCRVPLPAWSR